MAIVRSYAEYVEVVSAFEITPIDVEQWGEWQASLPSSKPVDMPRSLNHAIAVAIEAGDLYGAAQLIKECGEHDQECWMQYTTEGEYFPAGGLWFNQLDWMNGTRLDATPLTVAYLLDFDGELPDVQKNIAGEPSKPRAGSDSV